MQNKLYQISLPTSAGVPASLEAPAFSFFETAVEIARKEVKSWVKQPCACDNEAIPCFLCSGDDFEVVNTTFYPQAGPCAAGDDEFEVVKNADYEVR
jgi:hypothetical protein